MNTQNSNIQTENSDFSKLNIDRLKTYHPKPYIQPEIRFIQLDNEISLVLESNPMEGPLEGGGTYNLQNPYNTPQIPLA